MARPQFPPPPLLDDGWYPDPTGRYEARYWDGRKWTSHISHYGATGADPLLRAQYDYWWVRLLGRVAMWVLLVGICAWLITRFWPDDDRDLDADREMARTAIVSQPSLPKGWTPTAGTVLSIVGANVGDRGNVTPAGCASFAGIIENAADEPTTQTAVAAPDGVRSLAEEVVVWADSGGARAQLEAAREDAAGSCLADLWLQSVEGGGDTLRIDSIERQTDPDLADAAVWWRLVAERDDGLPVEEYADVVLVRSGRVVVTYRFSSTVDPVEPELQAAVMARHAAWIDELLDRADDPDADGAGLDGGDGGDTGVGDPADEAPEGDG